MIQMNQWGVKCDYCKGFNSKESHINLGICKHCGGELPMPDYPQDDYVVEELIRNIPLAPTWDSSFSPSYSMCSSSSFSMFRYNREPTIIMSTHGVSRPTTIMSTCGDKVHTILDGNEDYYDDSELDNSDDIQSNESIKPKEGLAVRLLKKVLS